ncbi:DUF5034 domain-containing protein [uncultured Dysgonomonas sp.]|uniref:DUF4625 domain-containing protein n=1 Tax=uncultured Dysgonomonas sp. TaxID=206096 RepID=A0A212JEJ2_9BACT|nr:DUF5034 domain-containing protein [uncultured Dysgonomonas sp.]SBV97832.1 conserved exported hypothetical protein [uncultured Dysgonomonas sp.]
MKLKISLYLLISFLFLLNTAMSCDEKEGGEPKAVTIKAIELYNINNEGQGPVISDEPIKKEAYMIGIRYLIEENEETTGLYYRVSDNIKSEQIVSNVDIGEEYPAGSDISGLFTKTSYTSILLDNAFVLKKSIPAGTYSFKVILTTKEDKVMEASTNLIELY